MNYCDIYVRFLSVSVLVYMYLRSSFGMISLPYRLCLVKYPQVKFGGVYSHDSEAFD